MSDASLLLLRDAWREVSRHLEIEALLSALFARVAADLPVRWARLFRWEAARARFTAVAETGVAPPGPARIDLPTPRVAEITRWAERRAVESWEHRDQDSLPRTLLAEGAEGPLVGLALAQDGELRGILLLGGALSESLAMVRELAEPLTTALDNDARLHALARVSEAAEADRRALLDRLDRGAVVEAVIGVESGLSEVAHRVRQVARTDAPVVLFGETGSGKEVIARSIHEQSARATGPFLKVNCGAIPAELVDSELFGHERGAFTGAVSARKGWFERADGGTLFLDELGELPANAQVRLLRVLQDGSFQRVGGERVLHADVRIIAATHRDLADLARRGSFRWDLWYRLSVFPIDIPPLRERRQDIPALARFFAARAGRHIHGRQLAPTDDDIAQLMTREWRGNVRELGAVIERAVILGDGTRLEIHAALGPDAGPRPVDDRAAIEEAVAACVGRIEGPFGAAAMLGVNAATLRSRMRRLGIDWERFRRRGDGPTG